MSPSRRRLKGARDRLRGGGDDADAGRGVRAAGLHARPHGRLFIEFALTLAGAVHRLGLRRADADADDVQPALLRHDPKPNRFWTAAWSACWWPGQRLMPRAAPGC